MATYRVLRCPNLHPIPIPPRTVKGLLRAHETGGPQVRQAIFVCPECGRAKSYSTSDIEKVPYPNDPFSAGECVLVEIQVECAGGDACGAPKLIYTLQLTKSGTLPPNAQPKPWDLTSVQCPNGHELRFDKAHGPHVAMPCSNPLLGPPSDEQ